MEFGDITPVVTHLRNEFVLRISPELGCQLVTKEQALSFQRNGWVNINPKVKMTWALNGKSWFILTSKDLEALAEIRNRWVRFPVENLPSRTAVMNFMLTSVAA